MYMFDIKDIHVYPKRCTSFIKFVRKNNFYQPNKFKIYGCSV